MKEPTVSGKAAVPVALAVCGALAFAIYAATFPARPHRPARSVHLRLSARPAWARFTLDGAPVASNPYEGDMPADGQQHRIEVQADGFEARSLATRFDRDVVVDVALAAAAPPQPGP